MKKTALCLFALLIVIASWQPCLAEADLEILERIALDATPLDVAVSDDGLWIYVLTEGRLNIYSQGGDLKGSVAVPEGSQRIALGSEEDILFVTNTAEKTLQAVRVNLEHEFTEEQSPTRGPVDAPVTLTLFTDFECSYCARLAPVLEEVHQAFPDKVRIVFKNFPLVRIHRFAAQSALAALAAEEQGQFWPFHDKLFQNFDRLNPQKIEEIRQELGLDTERFNARMNDPALKDLIRRDLQEGSDAGVNGTPTIFLNGKKYRGQRSLEGFREAIEALLGKS